MGLSEKKEEKAPKSQADLIFEAQQRKKLQFKVNVGLSWMVLIIILLFLFSGENFLGIRTIKLDTTFIKDNLLFIAGGLGETIRISLLSIALQLCLHCWRPLGVFPLFLPFMH